jgi:hypothetical protein
MATLGRARPRQPTARTSSAKAAVDQEHGVAAVPAGAGADVVALEHRHSQCQPGTLQEDRRPETGEPAATDHAIDRYRRVERGDGRTR